MQHAPTEIWNQISSHACTDSGSTGRSLSLVSKFIRETSAPFKLQSVAVHGPKQFISFNKLLLTTPLHLRRTRYLFISAILPTPPPRRGLSRLLPARKASETYPRWAEKDAGEIMSAFSSIIKQVAGSVEILYFEIPLPILPRHSLCARHCLRREVARGNSLYIICLYNIFRSLRFIAIC